MRDELRFVARIANREVEVGFGGQVKNRSPDAAQRLLQVPVEGWSGADVVLFPGAHLQNQVVSVRVRNEVRAVVVDDLGQGRAGWGVRLPEFLPPPFLRIKPCGPDKKKDCMPFSGSTV